MKYTKQQLIIAQRKWNIDFINNPSRYPNEIDNTLKYAEDQICHLLNLV